MDIEQLAQECLTYLQTKTRDNGQEFYCRSDDSPEWFDEMIYNCHNGNLPNDADYKAIWYCLVAISEDGEDAQGEINVGQYYSDLHQWFQDLPDSSEWCDTAMAQSHIDSIYEAMCRGMNSHYCNICGQLIEYLNDQLEE